MNDNQFEALLETMKNIAEELMFIRDEITGLRDLYGQVHGFESDGECIERIIKSFDGDDTDGSNVGQA